MPIPATIADFRVTWPPEDLAFRAGLRHCSPMPFFTANADYAESDTDPICLQAGDIVHAGPADRTWPGWVWAADARGRDGYVPEEILKPLCDGRAEATAAFDPTVLAVRRGDRLESLRQIHGWHWCRNEDGREGWVAGYLLRPA